MLHISDCILAAVDYGCPSDCTHVSIISESDSTDGSTTAAVTSVSSSPKFKPLFGPVTTSTTAVAGNIAYINS